MKEKDPDDNVETICLCKEGCMDSGSTYSVLAKLRVTLEKVAQSMCVPYKMTKPEEEEEDTGKHDGDWPWIKRGSTADDVIGVITGEAGYKQENWVNYACPEHKCLTEFPVTGNCIRKPASPDSVYPDDSVFKVTHTVKGNPATFDPVFEDAITEPIGGDKYISNCCYAEYSNCSGSYYNTTNTPASWTHIYRYDTSEFWSADYGFPTMRPIWLYRGWQMMGQISLSDYMMKYFGFSWETVPMCAHGGDCLSQWHFEILWRVTQAMLHGHFDQPQGVKYTEKVMYRLGHCGPPDCGIGPYPIGWLNTTVYGESPEVTLTSTVTYTVNAPIDCGSDGDATPDSVPASASSFDIHMSNSLAQAWEDYGVEASIAISGNKYWLRTGAIGYGNRASVRTYATVHVMSGHEMYGDPVDIDGISVVMEEQSQVTEEVKLHVALLVLLNTRYHAKDSKTWGSASLEEVLAYIDALKNKKGFITWFNTLLASFVVDGVIYPEQLGELIQVLPDDVISPRVYTLAVEYGQVRKLAEERFKEQEQIVIPDLPGRPELAHTLEEYVNNTVHIGDALLNPETVYKVAELFLPYTDKNDRFHVVYNKLQEDVLTGCTSCRINRLKKDLYNSFCFLCTHKDDKKRVRILNAWAEIVPNSYIIRVVDGLNFSDKRRWELIPDTYKEKKNIRIIAKMAVGDIISVTGAVKALKEKDPSYSIWVDTSCPELWENNPLIETGEAPEDVINIALGTSKEGYNNLHFIDVYGANLFNQLGLEYNNPPHSGDIYLTGLEKNPKYLYNKFGMRSKSYWIVVDGYKKDLPLKHWGSVKNADKYQELVDLTKESITWVQLGKTDERDYHVHFRLDNTCDLLGHTNNSLRDLLVLVFHARGVVCPNTCYMHISRVFDVPCVTIGGGKESVQWASYTRHWSKHVYRHTENLDCITDGSCEHGPDYCSNITGGGLCACMEAITPASVAENVLTLDKEHYE